jgi:phage anti-repressor protein
MNELIKITVGDGRQAVNARDLHDALGVGRDFSTWIKDRIEQYGFVEGEDFQIIVPKSGDYSRPGNPNFVPIDYLLTVGTAKEIAIVENNETGRKIRRYLIRVEQEHIALLESVRKDHEFLQYVYRQMEDYRIKYINLLDKLENNGMSVKEIWELSRVDRTALQKLRT